MKHVLMWLSPLFILTACLDEQRKAFLLRHQGELEKDTHTQFVVECRITQAEKGIQCDVVDTLFFKKAKGLLTELEPPTPPKTLDVRDPAAKIGEHYLAYGTLHPFSKCPVQIVDFFLVK